MKKNLLRIVVTLLTLVLIPFYSPAQFNNLHDFGEGDDGKQPFGNLLIAGSKMYGMTPQGGGGYLHYGTIFKCNPDGSEYTILHEFIYGADNGRFPIGSLLLSGTTLYGVTYNGGASDLGTIFKIETDGSGFTVLHSFLGGLDQGQNPCGSLVLTGTTLYGMTTYGGGGSGVFSNCGTIFKIETDGSNFSVLYNFSGGEEDGRSPNGSLILSGTTFFGMTSYGGTSDLGTIFKIETDGTGFTLLHTFDSSTNNGHEPRGSLVLSGSTLFGMTSNGGAYDAGTIFKIETNDSGFALLHSFSGGTKDGRKPWDSLLLYGTTLFGMTYQGGANDAGTIFKIGFDGTGFDLVHAFTGGVDDGKNPLGSLTCLGNTFYGMTQRGGYYDQGIVFSMQPPYLSLTAPNGGESMVLGSSQQITWSSAGLSGNVRLVLFRNGIKVGAIASVPSVLGAYNWSAGSYSGGTAAAGSGYTVRVVTADSLYSDTSDGKFTLKNPPFLRVVSPNGGESWTLGSQQTITWASSGISGYVRLVLYKGGVKLGVIASVPAITSSYTWTVGNHSNGKAGAGSGYSVRVMTADSLFTDTGDAYFTILN